jgi:hypothetical protein
LVGGHFVALGPPHRHTERHLYIKLEYHIISSNQCINYYKTCQKTKEEAFASQSIKFGSVRLTSEQLVLCPTDDAKAWTELQNDLPSCGIIKFYYKPETPSRRSSSGRMVKALIDNSPAEQLESVILSSDTKLKLLAMRLSLPRRPSAARLTTSRKMSSALVDLGRSDPDGEPSRSEKADKKRPPIRLTASTNS